MKRATSITATADSNDIAAGDLDRDGDQDLVVVSEGSSLTNTIIDLYLNDGTGRFTHTTATGGHGAQRVAVADLNGDGKVDLAITELHLAEDRERVVRQRQRNVRARDPVHGRAEHDRDRRRGPRRGRGPRPGGGLVRQHLPDVPGGAAAQRWNRAIQAG